MGKKVMLAVGGVVLIAGLGLGALRSRKHISGMKQSASLCGAEAGGGQENLPLQEQ
jgi:hypothetical protein